MKIPQTSAEVLEAIKSDTPLNRARRVFSCGSARIEQAGAQRKPLDPIEWRKMEFQVVAEIAAALGSPETSAETELATIRKSLKEVMTHQFKDELSTERNLHRWLCASWS